MSRAIPIIMDAGSLSDAARTHSSQAQEHAHEHAHERAHARTSAAAPDSAQLAHPPVFLRVADTDISESDIAQEMQHHRASDPHQSRAAAARALVVRELLRRECERLDIAAEVERLDGETLEEACIRALLEREVQVPEPTEAICRRYYANNGERLRRPDKLRVRHILLPAAPGDSAARIRASQLGEELIAELREHPQRFTEFALRHSACPSRDDGGELGWIERGQTTPEFDRQLFMLKPGLAGLTVETRYGHHVVQLDEIVRGESLAYSEAAGKIAAYLETQSRQNALQEYLQILQERYPVQGLDDLAG